MNEIDRIQEEIEAMEIKITGERQRITNIKDNIELQQLPINYLEEQIELIEDGEENEGEL
jgi:septal ring factor EnvC (AmiA/AmiB activator)